MDLLEKKSRARQAYIGIHDLFQEGDWVTVSGEPLDSTGYIQWSPDWGRSAQPNGGTEQNCGTLLVQGGMNDIRCKIETAFVCEKP